MSINRVIVTGNLTRDPDMRTTATGTVVLNFSIAVNDRCKNSQTGEWENRPSFIDCSLYGGRGESLVRHLEKGSKVALAGKLRQSTWTNTAGEKRSKIEIIVDDIDFMSYHSNDAQGEFNV